MKTSRRRGVVVVLSLVAMVGAVNAIGTGVASAAPVTIGGCDAASTGSTDTGAVSVRLDDALFANGTMIPLHDNTGGVTFPAPADNSMSAPICGAHKVADGSIDHEWLYCTAPDLNTCGTEPMVAKGSAATNVNTFTAVDKARLAWLLQNKIDNTDKDTRIASQRQVWCVTEHVAAGQNAPGYFKDARDGNLPCPNWPNLDPTLAVNPSVAVTAAAVSATNGDTVRFEVVTDAKELSVDATGFDGIDVCPGVAGASVANGTLSVVAPDKTKPVALCAWRSTAGAGTLQLTVAGITATTLEFWQRAAGTSACQGMLSTETSSLSGATARAAAVWAAAPVTVAPTTVAPPTVPDASIDATSTTSTTAGDVLGGATPQAVTLPRTGANGGSTDLRLPVSLLLIGVGLVLIGRRRTAGRI